MVRPVIVVLGAEGVVMVAVTGPLIWVQAPVPTTGVLALMVTEPGEEQMVPPLVPL